MRRQLVVGQICHGALGGSSRMACRLANALARRHHRVHLFSREHPPWTLRPDVQQHVCPNMRPCDLGSLCLDWPEGDRTAFAHMLTEWLIRERFDVLHFHYAQPFAGIVRQVAENLGDRAPLLVGTLHGTDLTGCLDSDTHRASLCRDLAAVDELTTVSEHMRQLCGQLMPHKPAVRVIPNFVEDDWGRQDQRSAMSDRSCRRPVLLHMSNFRAVKDVAVLAKLFLRLLRETDAELWLVGDGPELPVLRGQLDRSPAGVAVRYFGVRADPSRYFQQATFLVSASRQESFGLTVLEAMASGTVVVATGVGGIPELVEDSVTGVLFKSHEVDSTVARMLSLLGSTSEMDAMRTRAFNQVERLREARVIGLYEDLYQKAAGRSFNQLNAIA